MRGKMIRRFALPLLSLGLLASALPSALSAHGEAYQVTAAASSNVDSRFHEATTSNPWTYTDYQGSYYSGLDLNAKGDALLQSLATLTNSKYTGESYDGLKKGLPAVCKFADGRSGTLGFYDRSVLPSSWDSAKTWNREHVWPNSRGAGKSGAGANPYIIMPASVKINSSRGNKMYGLTSSTWDPGQYDVQFRGAAARSILYAAMQYNTTLKLGDNPSVVTNTMGLKSELLKWNLQYRPDADEMYRNNLTAKRYGARNPFIDYPYLADNIWGDGTAGGNTSSSETPVDPEPGEKPVYKLVKSVSELTAGTKVVFMAPGSTTKSTLFALHADIKSDKLPWYLLYDEVQTGISSLPETVETSLPLTPFTLEKEGEAYRFQNEDAGYLKSYVDGTHYSIGLTKKPGNQQTPEGTKDWTITLDANGEAVLKSSANVYLQFYESGKTMSWSGYKAEAKVSLYALQEKSAENEAETEAKAFATSFVEKIKPLYEASKKARSETPSEELLAAWEEMSSKAGELSAGAKTLLKSDSPIAPLKEAVSLYEAIVSEYGSTLNGHGGDFLFRKTKDGVLPSELPSEPAKERDLTPIYWTIAICILGAGLVGLTVWILLRKKKKASVKQSN